MKKVLLGIILGATLSSFAQDKTSYGVKAGLNYGATGKISDDVGNAYENPDRDLGYHVGVFLRSGEKFYFRPELVFTELRTKYDSDAFSLSKLDAPLLFGLNIIGPLNVFGGPSLQYILNTKYDGITLGEVESDFTVGVNFGVGIKINTIGIDLRYERGFSENEAQFLSTNSLITNDSRIDTRPDQLIISLSLSL